MILEWKYIEDQKPDKEFGSAYVFWVKPEPENIEQGGFVVAAIWNGFDWYLPQFESIDDYQGMSGNEYFEIYKPKFWTEFRASNLVY